MEDLRRSMLDPSPCSSGIVILFCRQTLLCPEDAGPAQGHGKRSTRNQDQMHGKVKS